MKKYTEAQISAMRKQLKANIDESLDVLADLEVSDQPRKQGKSDVVCEETYYEEECITDYRKKPYEICLFVRTYTLRLTPKGRAILECKKDVLSFTANTHKELARKLEEFTDEHMTLPSEAYENGKWFPSDFEEKKKALQSLAPGKS